MPRRSIDLQNGGFSSDLEVSRKNGGIPLESDSPSNHIRMDGLSLRETEMEVRESGASVLQPLEIVRKLLFSVGGLPSQLTGNAIGF